MLELILLSLSAAIGISISSAPVGAILLWQRMAFLGDTLAHASLLGVALALACSLPIMLGVFIITLLLSYLIGTNNKFSSNDSILAIIVYGCLSGAVLIISKIKINLELESYLFGDILAINGSDILIIYALAIVITSWVYWRWDKIILICINKDLADSSNINSDKILLEFRIMVALLIGLSMKIVGILLVSALLIIPGAAARNLSDTPEEMVLLAVVISVFSSIAGIITAFYFNLPVGATIIITTLSLFAITSYRNIKRGK